jgi:hypothetical protein
MDGGLPGDGPGILLTAAPNFQKIRHRGMLAEEMKKCEVVANPKWTNRDIYTPAGWIVYKSQWRILPNAPIIEANNAEVMVSTVNGPFSAHRRSTSLTHLWKILRQIIAVYEKKHTPNVKKHGNKAITVMSFKAGLVKIHVAICPPKKISKKVVNEWADITKTAGKKNHKIGVYRTVKKRRKTLATIATNVQIFDGVVFAVRLSTKGR